jgi:hypothetical protein
MGLDDYAVSDADGAENDAEEVSKSVHLKLHVYLTHLHVGVCPRSVLDSCGC